MMDETRINIQKIIAFHNAENVEVLNKNAKTRKHIFQRGNCVLREGGYLIFDFGKELCGRAHVVFGWSGSARIRVRMGESVYETCAEIGEKNAGNYHSLRDNVFPCVMLGDISTSESGFRFVRIDLVEGEEALISDVYAQPTPNGLSEQGNFLCDDESVNRIYETAARTLSLCVRQDDVWDGIKRDRIMWMGDLYPELVGASALFGSVPQFKRALSAVKDFDGKWINMIPAYSAWWIICLCEYYELSDDAEFTRSMMGYVEQIVNDFSVIIKENGEVSYKNNTLAYFDANEFFIDWPTNQTEDSEIGWRYLVIIAMQKAKFLCEKFGKNFEKAETLANYLRRYSYKQSSFKQVTALGVLAGMIDSETARPLLKYGGAEGMTGFMGCAIIKALEKLGEEDFIVELIKEYYGAMIDLGATTLWEDFDIEWLKEKPLSLSAMPTDGQKNIHADYGKFCYTGLRHSLCHGWSAGFITVFFEYMLGIRRLSVGYSKIKIQPRLCGLTRAEGTLPTPYGNIYVKHEIVDGEIVSTVKVPNGVEVAE